MKTHARVKDLAMAGGGGGMGVDSAIWAITKLHLAQQSWDCSPLQRGRRPQSFAHSKAVSLGSSAVATSHQVPTGSQRGCGAGEVRRQWEWAQDKKMKGSQAYSQPAPQGFTHYVPLFPHMAASSLYPLLHPFPPHPLRHHHAPAPPA